VADLYRNASERTWLQGLQGLPHLGRSHGCHNPWDHIFSDGKFRLLMLSRRRAGGQLCCIRWIGCDCSRSSTRTRGCSEFSRHWRLCHANGQHVRWGEVYCSSELSKLTAADADKVASLNLVSVIDLRTESERQQAPSIWLHSTPADLYKSPKPTLRSTPK
jgi:hypothetical protein